MFKTLRHNSGQASLPEYVVTFFIVIGVVVAMTTYFQRALQGRIQDATTVVAKTANEACDKDCKNATGLTENQSIPREYEPYYVQAVSDVNRTTEENRAYLSGKPTGIFVKNSNAEVEVRSDSTQLAPKEGENVP